ncbi:MAG: hypothetical protein QM657_03695 [Lacrimispora sp.]|uniref:hypothetical protein n=1 Tax=Lacrimispora sp. TaxID=2719234 RepID=UPI0039E627A3
MDNKNLQAEFIDKVNALLPSIDFLKLDKSCNSNDDGYAKEILKKLHDAFIEAYHTDNLEEGSYDFVELPAVIRGRNTGHIGLGIVTLDLEASGEHWGTFFFSPKGVIDQGGSKMDPGEFQYLSNVYIPYDYWYTVSLECDIHIDFTCVPQKVSEMLEHCHNNQQEEKQTPARLDGTVEMR